jgi:hypothetical protein
MKVDVKSVNNRKVLDAQKDGLLTQKKVINWEVEKYPSLGRSDHNLEDGAVYFSESVVFTWNITLCNIKNTTKLNNHNLIP